MATMFSGKASMLPGWNPRCMFLLNTLKLLARAERVPLSVRATKGTEVTHRKKNTVTQNNKGEMRFSGVSAGARFAYTNLKPTRKGKISGNCNRAVGYA